MGDIKKPKKQYSTSRHPWIRREIEEFKELRKEYGLKNRREILKAISFLRKYKNIAKKLITSQTKQGEVERKQMVDKLNKLGLISTSASLDDVLSLQTKDIMNRRLESVVLRKGLARSIKQARQFITHRHITIGDKEMTSPSYLVLSEEENKVGFKINSSLSNADHPERTIIVKEKKEDQSPEKKDNNSKKDYKKGKYFKKTDKENKRVYQK